ncbi:MAG: hypothetical protein E6H63_19425 [Betaproteobacteria bacterium]|nr:MAG: hypothetical protein E6H63_19425 [Betaproteobacteria bacterium]
MRLAFAAIGFIAAATLSGSADACRCAFRSLPEYFDAADHVFLAEIREIHTEHSADLDYRVVTKFITLETFKGSPTELTSIRSREGECNLRYPLTPGERALVFIRKESHAVALGATTQNETGMK